MTIGFVIISIGREHPYLYDRMKLLRLQKNSRTRILRVCKIIYGSDCRVKNYCHFCCSESKARSSAFMLGSELLAARVLTYFTAIELRWIATPSQTKKRQKTAVHVEELGGQKHIIDQVQGNSRRILYWIIIYTFVPACHYQDPQFPSMLSSMASFCV